MAIQSGSPVSVTSPARAVELSRGGRRHLKALLAAMCAGVVLTLASVAAAQAADGPRLRFGGSLTGGLLVLPDPTGATKDTLLFPAAGFALHVGVQVNEPLSFVYVNSPTFGFYVGDKKRDPYFVDYNSVLAQLTLANCFDIGAGPSLAILEGKDAYSARFGVNSRVAFLIRGIPPRPAPRRTALSINLESQVTPVPGGAAILTTLGVGSEFY